MVISNSRALATTRLSKLKRNICNNPGCNAQIKGHLWINKGIYCTPWCERNFGKNPSENFFKKRK